MSNKNGFRVVERRGVVRTLRFFYMPGAVLTLFKWGEKGFYTFYTFYNVNNEIFIYSTYILQTFYKILQNAVFVKTFYKLLHFLHNFYNCRSLIKS